MDIPLVFRCVVCKSEKRSDNHWFRVESENGGILISRFNPAEDVHLFKGMVSVAGNLVCGDNCRNIEVGRMLGEQKAAPNEQGKDS